MAQLLGKNTKKNKKQKPNNIAIIPTGGALYTVSCEKILQIYN